MYDGDQAGGREGFASEGGVEHRPRRRDDVDSIVVTMLSISECLLGAKYCFECFRCIN